MNAYTVADKMCEASIGPTQGQLDDIMRIIEEVMNAYVDIDTFEQEANKRMAEEGYPIRFDRRDELLNQNHAPGRVGEDAMVLMPPQFFSLDMLRHVISHEGVHVFQMAAAERKGKAAEMFKSSHDRMIKPGGHYDRDAYYTDKHEVMAHARSLIDKYRAQRMNKRQALQQLRTDPSAGRVHREQRKRFLKNAYNYAQDLPEAADPDDPDSYLKRLKMDRRCRHCGRRELSLLNAEQARLSGLRSDIEIWQCEFCGRLANTPPIVAETSAPDEHSDEINIGKGFRLSVDMNSMVLYNRLGKPCGSLYWQQHSAGGQVIELEHMEVDCPNRGLGETMLKEFVRIVRQQHPAARYVRGSATSLGIVRLLRRVFGPEVRETDLFKLPARAPDDWVYARNAATVKYRIPESADPDDVNPLEYAMGSIDPLFAALANLGFEYDAGDRMSLKLPHQRLIHVYAKNQWSPKYIAELWFIGGHARTGTDKVERKNAASILQHVEQWIATYRGIAEAADPDEFDPQSYIDSTPLHRIGRPKLDEFTTSYAACALWSTNDNSDPETGGEPMDRNYDIDDIEDDTLWDMVDDCVNFRQQHAELLERSGLSDERAGFCFWLSRNGHGSGFFDEGTEVDDELQAAAEVFGNVDFEVSDEGTIYAL